MSLDPDDAETFTALRARSKAHLDTQLGLTAMDLLPISLNKMHRSKPWGPTKTPMFCWQSSVSICLFRFLILTSNTCFGREVGETEITTTQGIEVFQIEKYYLLKENVNIITDTFELSADLVKAYFEIDLYDITKIECSGNSKMKTSEGMNAMGEKIHLSMRDEFIEVIGRDSS